MEGRKEKRREARPPAPPTLRDVARAAGVSPSTVSATLNEAPRAKHYSAETKKRIQQVARELGYVANPLARTLKRARSGLLGVLTPSQSGIYYAPLIEAARERAALRGLEVVVAGFGYDPAQLIQSLNFFQAWSVEAILLMMGGFPLEPPVVARLEDMAIPVLMAAARSQKSPFSTLTFNNHEAGRQLIHHLADLGHERIGVLAAMERNRQSEDRLSGMLEVMKKRGVAADERILRAYDADVGIAAGMRYAAEIFGRYDDLTALVCHNDLMAIGANRWLREQGRSVPEGVSVAGFDDLCLENKDDADNRLCAYLSPALTTVRVPIRAMGAEAVDILHQTISDPNLRDVRKTVEFEPELIIRDSTGPAPS